MNSVTSQSSHNNNSENSERIEFSSKYLADTFKANGFENIAFSPEKFPEYIGILLRDLVINVLKSNGIVFDFDSGGANNFPQLSKYNNITENVFSELQKHFKVVFNYIDIKSDLQVDKNKMIKSVELIDTQINDLSKIISKAILDSLKNSKVTLKKEDILNELSHQLGKYFLLKFEKYTPVGRVVSNVGRVVSNISLGKKN